VSARDLPLIQVTALFLAAVYVVVNLVADLLVVRLTPRLRGVGV
jgi:peptide/nickel transport system permease protein